MIYFSLIVGVAFLVLTLIQVSPTLHFLRRLRHPRTELLADGDCPKAAIVFCIRGKDIGLKECLEALRQQDYPDFTIQVVVDHEEDSAFQEVQQIASADPDGKFVVSTLETRYDTCSLKCSSQIQAINSLDKSIEFVAFIDADVIPHTSWLRELTSELAKGDADIVMGQRWYLPDRITLASIVRVVWNARAVIHAAEKCAWGGSFALTAKFIHESNIIDSWKKSFSDDGAMSACADSHGLRVSFVPSVLMINRDEFFDIASIWGFLLRQLVIGRLYTKHWSLVFWLNALTTGTLIAAIASVVIGLTTQFWLSAIIPAVGAFVYFFAMWIQLLVSDGAIRRIAKERDEDCRSLTVLDKLFFFIALPVYQLVDIMSITAATFARRVTWRGIDYRLDGPWEIQVLGYQPYGASTQSAEATTSN